MGYTITKQVFDNIINDLSGEYVFYAPKKLIGKGSFSDTDRVRYEQITNVDEIELNEKSHFSYKEVVLPMSQTLFYFTEDTVTEPKQRKEGAVVFLRSCDMHSIKRLDEMYLNNGAVDIYYKNLRDKMIFVLLDCENSFENCFCVSMGTNKTDEYDFTFSVNGDEIKIDNKWNVLDDVIKKYDFVTTEVTPKFVENNNIKVEIPQDVTNAVFDHDIWEEYNTRCIGCGRCNFVCPTCTCFTMQDIFYEDNGKVGERRRVWASCHTDNYTDMAGGHAFRKKKGERMRFKVLHKVHDYNKRFGYHMCVGCGRCDDICPEYISFSNAVNKLAKATKEGK